MELGLTDDQSFFAETTRKFLADKCSIGAVRALEASPDGFDRDVWKAGCELGWTSLLVSEADGGGSISGHGLLDAVLVAEEMGRMVAPGPFVPCNVVAYAIAMGGSAEQKQRWLPGLISGDLIGAWVLPGNPVEAGAQADVLLVGDRLVAADAPGVEVAPMEGLDLTRRFAAVRVPAGAGEPLVASPTALLQIAVASAERRDVRRDRSRLPHDARLHGRPVLVRPAHRRRTKRSSTAWPTTRCSSRRATPIATAAARAIAHRARRRERVDRQRGRRRTSAPLPPS